MIAMYHPREERMATFGGQANIPFLCHQTNLSHASPLTEHL
jgi:hypothetical protein